MEDKEVVGRGTEAGRIVYFSDAVFAVAITLLVFQIRVPDGLSPQELTAALVDLWPEYLSYLTSFTVIGSFWRTHHLIFRHVKAYDGPLIFLNLLFLMCVAFLPFSSSLLGEYPEQRIAFEIYAGGFAVAGFPLAGMWWHATRDRRLTDGDLDPRLVRKIMTERLLTSAIALIAVPITFFFGVRAVLYSVLAFFLIWLVVQTILPRLRTRLRPQEPADEPTNEHEKEQETK